MKKLLTRTLVVAAVGVAFFGSTPASAASFSINVGFRGTGFSYSSGGYCDRWGCPDQFWDYPIYYCPVYYRGRWYTGPVYYRHVRGGYAYWIHGGWRRDMWNRSRPRGVCVDRYGPPLDLDFYIWNGFNVRDQWRYDWRNQRSDWWQRRQEWDRSNRGDTSWQAWVPTQQRSYDWNRQRSWNTDREWSRPDWNRRDWELRNRTNSGGAPVSPSNTFTGSRPAVNSGAPTVAPSPTTPAFIPPAPNNPPADNRGRDRHRSGSNNQGGGGSPATPTPMAPATTQPVVNAAPTDSGGRGHKGGQDNQGHGDAAGVTAVQPAQTTPAVNTPATDSSSGNGNGNHHKHKGGKEGKEGKDDKGADPNKSQ